MIVPMKKVSLVVQDKAKNQALRKMREIGVIHLEKTTAVSDTHSNVVERKTRIEGAIGLIQHYKIPKVKKQQQQGGQERRAPVTGVRRGRRATDVFGAEHTEPFLLDAVRAPERPFLADLMMGFGRDRKTLQDRITLLNREKTRIAPWGEFDPASVKEMESLGVPVFLYEISHETFASIQKDIDYIKIGSDKAAVRLMVFFNEIPGFTIFPLPEKSLSALIEEENQEKILLNNLEAKIKSFANRRPVLLKDMAIAQQDIDFEVAMTGMEKIEDIQAEHEFSCLTGFVPHDALEQLKNTASENNWAIAAVDPCPEEQVPTKLKNNRLVELLYPLTSFLEVTPGYREKDISPWFLMFFCIFFGMIFGDAAYGIILLSIALFGIIKTAKTGVPEALKFMILLCISNITWGVLTCSWFGIDQEILPQFLKDISLSYISTAKTNEAVVNQNLQIFCFSLALLHLSIGRIVNIFRNIRSLKVIAEFGQFMMLWGMYNVVLFLVASTEARAFPLLPVSLYLIGSGFFLLFLFGSYEGNIFKSILESIKNIISVVLSITNVFSDIMSYIRLWAVGLAGASIAATVNGMAGPMLGSFLVFLGMLFLLIGHGMNLMLNTLSVLVHGVRLNTLEFSNHAGIIWSGTAYKPFMEYKDASRNFANR